MIYKISPCTKPRMTQRDKWKQRPCVVKYRSFKDECRSQDLELFESMSVVFEIEMPKSWSAKKKSEMDGEPHQQKPDVDNLVKGLLDTMLEDSHVWRVHAEKRWATEGKIKIEKLA